MEKSFPLEAEGNCGEAACFPAPVSRWYQQTEQYLQPLAMCDGTARSLTLTSFGSPSNRKSF
ncbi:MAG: hypothetical protein LBQ54_15395 [Planctomycetaceae bacterium]|nr:hypothetical protein [Planctomycetaceae bacterium]